MPAESRRNPVILRLHNESIYSTEFFAGIERISPDMIGNYIANFNTKPGDYLGIPSEASNDSRSQSSTQAAVSSPYFLDFRRETMAGRSGTRMDSQRTAGEGASPYSLGVSRQSPGVPEMTMDEIEGHA
ncbi:hypothetical protein MGYG_08306 [Nannizzia gypsea CBS 118893]|uniref:Uncharacterized protein n=1 Tax=Arthroderma gypseum (strain ATCC MYA-4604 / CBS 118893) TaxID=535722 RepID=E4V6B2_ARTGP|nr:hypothetical protein MGYG_08306 [Nannizzia gypsea CBS 118893]EFR05295.1 hypothetical protein MGYG_08306 [Nannizzia gypsea CBS 118893]